MTNKPETTLRQIADDAFDLPEDFWTKGDDSMSDEPRTTDLDLAEELIVGRLKRYAARTARRPEQAGLLKADKVISMIRERFSFVRTGRVLQRERGRGERDMILDRGMPDIPLPDALIGKSA